jgi:quercetin dioxygenase-like cupin family protein
MSDVTIKSADDFDGAFSGGFKLVRHGLGVSSFGIQMIEMPPSADQYPEHDHSHDNQEEVYTVLEGKAILQVGGEQHELTPGAFARVGPGEKRKIVTGEEGCRLLAIGGTPGAVYEIPEFTKPQEQPA